MYDVINLFIMCRNGVSEMKLNVKKLRKEKDTVVVSSKESLKDIEYIKWSDKVLSGKKTVDIKEMIK